MPMIFQPEQAATLAAALRSRAPVPAAPEPPRGPFFARAIEAQRVADEARNAEALTRATTWSPPEAGQET